MKENKGENMKTETFKIEQEKDENSHIIHLWEPLEFNIDENYEYVPRGLLFSIFSNFIYYGIAFPILKVLTKVVYDLKIEGKENIKNLQGGAVTVSNHVLVLDCAMVGLGCGKRKIYYTTGEGSFKIPFVKDLIKVLRAIPIPEKIKNRKYFIKAIDDILQKGEFVHFYLEASLWPYYKKIRKFKNGAFDFAVRNKVPVIPMVFTFRKPKGIRRFLKRKKDVTLTILKPIICDEGNDNKKQEIENLKQRVHQEMEKYRYVGD